MPEGVEILIMGMSTRAAASSAMRYGMRPFCVDYFADFDLIASCPVKRVDSASAATDFLNVANSLPPTYWFFTGALENHPDLVEDVSRRHHLLGTHASTLRAIRNPISVGRVLRRHGIPTPEVKVDRTGLPSDGSWLMKPIASGGGLRIERLTDGTLPRAYSCYFQQFLEGPSFSAFFVGESGRARLIGITQQWVGNSATDFVYRGSIGPHPVSTELSGSLERLGNCLADEFQIVGWFGVDYILCEGIPWPVEINPRYTGSIEIHELALGRSMLAAHYRACVGDSDSRSDPVYDGTTRDLIIAKRILYATRRIIMPSLQEAQPARGTFDVPRIADITVPGTCIEPGEPVMTLFATGPDLDTCLERSREIEQTWMERLGFIEDYEGANP